VITAALSIAAIVVAIAVGTLGRVNVGLVSIAFAFVIGHFMVGMPSGEIVGGWPVGLFFMLLGMTLLFGIARVNGTLAILAERAVAATLGHTRLIPPAFFLMAGVLAAVGAGNIVVCAIVLPIALTVAVDREISPLLMATMVIAGSNAGGLSPLAPTGIIANTLSAEQGFDIAAEIFTKQIVGQGILAVILYFVLKGHRLEPRDAVAVGVGEGAGAGGNEAGAGGAMRGSSEGARAPGVRPAPEEATAGLDRAQKTTVAVLLAVVACIVGLGWDIGLTAFAGAVVLLFLRAAKEVEAFQAIPWVTIILVCGVTVLVNVAEQAGGIELLSDAFTRIMNEGTAGPVMALIGGTLSLVSSASGVVLPTLIPTVPGLVAETGGDATRIISSIVMGAHMVTNSPISTLGALAVASAGFGVDRERLFRQLFAVGIAGIFYAAAIVWLGVV
jgi:Na+/H+ antiporter NhaD/arsenite permease-like protein